jgi:hypothetical protein
LDTLALWRACRAEVSRGEMSKFFGVEILPERSWKEETEVMGRIL